MKGKALVAMSGGVDSSVAAALLKRDGYEVVGCFMRLGSPGDAIDEMQDFDREGVSCDPEKMRIGHQGCCSINDAADARLVASKLDIPFYVCNFKKNFRRIIDYFVEEYNVGKTPNPCIRCNDWLKFGKLHEYAHQIGAESIASGHYARIERDHAGEARLLRGVDESKDQSYVLFGTPRDRLREMLLPIGNYHKSKIRELAADFDLPVFDKPDSQEICFVPDQDYAGLVKRRTPDKVSPGEIVDCERQVIGEHPGHQHFTIGQRRGVGVALGYPIYVIDKNPSTNTVTVGPKERLLASECVANDINWLTDEPNRRTTIRCSAKIRYNAEAVPSEFKIASDGRSFAVRFDELQAAVAPGQAIVLYDAGRSEMVLGGGWIESASAAD